MTILDGISRAVLDKATELLCAYAAAGASAASPSGKLGAPLVGLRRLPKGADPGARLRGAVRGRCEPSGPRFRGSA